MEGAGDEGISTLILFYFLDQGREGRVDMD